MLFPPPINHPPHFLARDTVQSVGLIPKHLPFSGSNNAILHFRHALALDERRVKFFPSFCTGGKPKVEKTDTKTSEHSDVASKDSHNRIERRQRSGKSYEYELHVNSLTGPETDVEEVFFAGAHCGTFSSIDPQPSPSLSMRFQMSGVGPSPMANVTVSRAFPFDG